MSFINLRKVFHFVLFLAFLEGLCFGNPFSGLLKSKCAVIHGDCPNENVTFWLYTRQTKDTPLKLDPSQISAELFQPSKPLYILLHGYTGDRDFSPNVYIRPALLDTIDANVISVDYAPLAPEPCYFAAVGNAPLVSKCLGHFINTLVDDDMVDNDDIHIIGFSLGAQVAGQTSNYVNRRLKRITGLDPAKPMFITASLERKLDPTDAEFVDVIHTDVLGRGMMRRSGHADYYVNVGAYQPGCQLENKEDPGSCNHDRAPQYYAESIRYPDSFWAYACPSWMHSVFGLCDEYSNDEIMGYHVKPSVSGAFFLRTREKSPFGLGRKLTVKTCSLRQPLYAFNKIYDEDFEPQLQKGFVDWTDYDFDEFRKMTHFDEGQTMAGNRQKNMGDPQVCKSDDRT